MSTTLEKFEEWAIVEIMGHKRFAGRVTEQAIGGASFVRIDVPDIELKTGDVLPAFTKLFGAASVYCISPTTKEAALAFAESIRAESFHRFELPRLTSNTRPASTVGTDAFDLDEPDDDEF
jgi:hypothetical protein